MSGSYAVATRHCRPSSGHASAVCRKRRIRAFTSAGCAGCHTLADAGSNGNVGPNLDEARPNLVRVTTRVTNGKDPMPSFKGQLDATQIADVAAYVSNVAGKK